MKTILAILNIAEGWHSGFEVSPERDYGPSFRNTVGRFVRKSSGIA